MLIFNTTFLVPDNLQIKWLQWVRDHHIPFVMASGVFSKPQVARVLSVEEQEGTSYSVQMHVADVEILEQWHKQYAADFQRDFSEKFGGDVLFFASILELIE